MKCSILEVSLLLVVLNPGTAEDGDQKVDPELVLSNGSSPVFLPCSSRSHTQIRAIHWIFEPASGNNGVRICFVDDRTPQCNSSLFPHVTLAEADGFRTGNYSLLFTATMKDAGIYTCFLYLKHLNIRMTIRLIVINVSVTPAGPISLETSVKLTCEMSDPSYFNSINWSIENTRVTGEGILIQWKLNNGLILKGKRHTLDFRTLNISNVQLPDAGLYTYTVRLKNGKLCSYSRLLEISGTATTSLTTDNPPTGTSDPTKTSKSIPLITGLTVGLTVLAFAMILIVLLIKKKHKSAKGKEESDGTYVNVPPQRKKTQQDESDLNSTYMGLKLEEQSVYSQLQRNDSNTV